MRKRLALLAAVLTALALVVPVQAAVNDGVRIEYDGFGRVELDFARDVRYRDVQLSVQNEEGNACEALIAEMDDDELSFIVKDIVPGNYSFVLSGLRFGWTGEYESFAGAFRVPDENEVVIKSVDYDADDRELELGFNARVQLEQPQVTLKDAEGKEYDVKLREWDEDGIELRVEKLARGAEYTVTVQGVKPFGFENAVGVSTVFTAR